jgi:hypothetical protein
LAARNTAAITGSSSAMSRKTFGPDPHLLSRLTGAKRRTESYPTFRRDSCAFSRSPRTLLGTQWGTDGSASRSGSKGLARIGQRRRRSIERAPHGLHRAPCWIAPRSIRFPLVDCCPGQRRHGERRRSLKWAQDGGFRRGGYGHCRLATNVAGRRSTRRNATECRFPTCRSPIGRHVTASGRYSSP